MKRLQTSNALKVFITTLITIGFISGICYFLLLNDINKTNIINKVSTISDLINSTHQNMILKHFIITIILFFLAYTIIGVPIIVFYLFYQSASIGFLISAFCSVYHIKGIIFGSVFAIICQLLYLIVLIYITYLSFKISKKMLRVIILKEPDSLYEAIKGLFAKLVVIISIVLIYDLLLYFFANNILKVFLFLIK